MPSIITIKRRKIDRQLGREFTNQHYSPKQRLEAVTMYLMVGKVSLIAASLGIPEETIHRWKATDWWKDMVADVRSQTNVEVSGKLKGIVKKSMEIIEDRLENGDYQFNPRTGKFIRKHIGAKVAGDILSKVIDKQILIDKIETAPVMDKAKIEDRLKAIQDKLLEVSRFHNAKTINGVKNVQNSDPSPQESLPSSSVSV